MYFADRSTRRARTARRRARRRRRARTPFLKPTGFGDDRRPFRSPIVARSGAGSTRRGDRTDRCVRLRECPELGRPVARERRPVHDASVVGSRSARRSSVGTRSGPHDIAWKIASAPIAGVTTLSVVTAGPSPTWVNRSPANSVEVVSSNQSPLSQLCGTCGVGRNRSRCVPRSSDLAVGHRTGRTVGQVVQRHHARQLAVDDLGLRRRGEELVHRAALVGLDVARTRSSAGRRAARSRGDRLGHQREQRPHPGVEQERLLVADEELVEREPGRARSRRHQVESRKMSGAISSILVSIWGPPPSRPPVRRCLITIASYRRRPHRADPPIRGTPICRRGAGQRAPGPPPRPGCGRRAWSGCCRRGARRSWAR